MQWPCLTPQESGVQEPSKRTSINDTKQILLECHESPQAERLALIPCLIQNEEFFSRNQRYRVIAEATGVLGIDRIVGDITTTVAIAGGGVDSAFTETTLES